MDLPSALPLALSFSSSSSSSSASFAASSISTANAFIIAKESLCGEPVSASSYTNSITNHHQLVDQCSCSCMIPMYDTCQAGHESKKRKAVSSDQQEDQLAGAHILSTVPAKFSLQSKVSRRLNCGDESTVKDEYPEGEEEEELADCTTPPHLQSSACNATPNRQLQDCMLENDELPMANNADLDRELLISEYYEHTLSAKAADGQEVERCHICSVAGGDGLETTESISKLSYDQTCESCSSCSGTKIGTRGGMPPPPPRKPKAVPRILTSNHLNFFVPPDLDLFFSSTSSTSTATCTAAVPFMTP